MPSRDSIIHREDLPRVKLEIPGGNGGNVSISRPQMGAGHLGDDTHSQMGLEEAQDEHDKDSSISPSDEKDESMGGDERHTSPTLDKKKMKRFRYAIGRSCGLAKHVADMLPG